MFCLSKRITCTRSEQTKLKHRSRLLFLLPVKHLSLQTVLRAVTPIGLEVRHSVSEQRTSDIFVSTKSPHGVKPRRLNLTATLFEVILHWFSLRTLGTGELLRCNGFKLNSDSSINRIYCICNSYFLRTWFITKSGCLVCYLR